MTRERFYKLKIVSLLHDPPSKPWILTRQYEAHLPPNEHLRKEQHENESLWLIYRLFPDLIEEYDSYEVKVADAISAAFDRWILGMIVGKTSGVYATMKVIFRNLLMPDSTKEPKPPKEKNVEKFVEELKEILNGIDDWKLKYHLLYAIYEALWYKYNSESTGPADTRVPIFSVFDHCYASTTILNAAHSEEFRGLIVRIDLAGVQRFISAARKLRDVWISSWFASAFAWSLIEKFITEYGPDILIKPTARNNPFYAHTLLTMLKKNNLLSKIKNKLEEIISNWYGYNFNSNFPEHAVIPSQIDLLLPSLTSEVVKETLEKRYRELWNQAVKVILDGFYNYLSEKQGDRYEWLKRSINNAFDILKKMGFHEQPPLYLRLILLDFKSKRTKSNITDYYDVIINNKSLGEKPIYELYDLLMEELNKVSGKISETKVDPAIGLKLTEWSKTKYNENKLFEYCTCCGYLPSVLEIPHEKCNQIESRSCDQCPKSEECYGKQIYDRVMPFREEIYFSPGERLCGWCLIKRLMSHPEVFPIVCRTLLGEVGEITKRDFPSVSDITTIPFKEELMELIQAHPNTVKEITELYGKTLMELMEKSEGDLKWIYLISEYLRKWKPYEKLANKLRNLIKDEKTFEEFSYYIFGPSEEMLFRPYALKYSKELEGLIRSKLKRVRVEFTSNYSLIRADADSMGSLFMGRVEEALGFDITTWLEKISIEDEKNSIDTLGGIIKVLIKRVNNELSDKEWNNVINKLAQKTGEHINDLTIRLNDLCKELKRMKDRGRIFISPSYQSSISRALMIQSFIDLKVIEELNGFIIYAGGDDLLAAAPVKYSLPAVYETRKVFSKGDGDGFYSIFGSLVPSLGRLGRSYCIFFAHYRHPLSMVLSHSYKLLDGKGRITTMWEDKKRSKDVCFLAYSPGGKLKISRIPLREIKGVPYAHFISIIYNISDLIWKGEIGRQIIYDILESEPLINNMFKNRNLLVSYLNTIAKRHTNEKINLLNYLVELIQFELEEDGKRINMIIEAFSGIGNYISARG